jgi:oligoribonuclease NrnB/cAMP/cGMP phosphodiesterase (DHH superfamily)
MSQKYRLITRAELDGVTCAALLKELGMIDEVAFAHPKDMQDGKVDVTDRDIIANLPYNPKAHMVFDHHASEAIRLKDKPANLVLDPNAPSAANVIYRHFGGEKRFPNISKELLETTDKIDSAQVTQDEILDPKGWVLLGFIMDNRTGVGRHRKFRISNFQLMMELIDILRQHNNIDDILHHHDVAERVRLYAEDAKLARHQIIKCAEFKDKLVVLDYRHETEIFATNRFMVYAMYPDSNISMHVLPGGAAGTTVFAVGKSVINRSAKLDVGKLMLEYGGGGHVAVGTCQVENARAETVKAELIKRITEAG